MRKLLIMCMVFALRISGSVAQHSFTATSTVDFTSINEIPVPEISSKNSTLVLLFTLHNSVNLLETAGYELRFYIKHNSELSVLLDSPWREGLVCGSTSTCTNLALSVSSLEIPYIGEYVYLAIGYEGTITSFDYTVEYLYIEPTQFTELTQTTFYATDTFASSNEVFVYEMSHDAIDYIRGKAHFTLEIFPASNFRLQFNLVYLDGSSSSYSGVTSSPTGLSNQTFRINIYDDLDDLQALQVLMTTLGELETYELHIEVVSILRGSWFLAYLCVFLPSVLSTVLVLVWTRPGKILSQGKGNDAYIVVGNAYSILSHKISLRLIVPANVIALLSIATGSIITNTTYSVPCISLGIVFLALYIYTESKEGALSTLSSKLSSFDNFRCTYFDQPVVSEGMLVLGAEWFNGCESLHIPVNISPLKVLDITECSGGSHLATLCGTLGEGSGKDELYLNNLRWNLTEKHGHRPGFKISTTLDISSYKHLSIFIHPEGKEGIYRNLLDHFSIVLFVCGAATMSGLALLYALPAIQYSIPFKYEVWRQGIVLEEGIDYSQSGDEHCISIKDATCNDHLQKA